MKSISGSIVILAGIYGITATLPLMVMAQSIFPYLGFIASGVALALGLIAWWAALKHDH